jgi:high-affinity iron transporter
MDVRRREGRLPPARTEARYVPAPVNPSPSAPPAPRHRLKGLTGRVGLVLAVAVVAGVLVWQAVTASGSPDPTAAHTSATVAVFDIGVLTFREGLECILVLAAVTASMVGAERPFRRPVAAGAAVAFGATVLTWWGVAGVVRRLSDSVSALALQAATGLLAIVVLLVVMNWFFHRVYWTGWISLHTRRKRSLLGSAGVARGRGGAAGGAVSRRRLLIGLGLLGFTSLYREGVEVVLFLQSYRLQLGDAVVLRGVAVGLALTAIVAVLTFVAQRHLPYRRMLVLTGVLLGGVLLVMVGEQVQEMQLAHWVPTTTIRWLRGAIPGWAQLWLSIFPTVQTLAAQLLAALLVVGSYAVARARVAGGGRGLERATSA